ncbi:MAG TPA: hemerythrin domain-containing protein [Prolixibacteraceae bacterium]|nr:hemerythrin domain-containing protein [Prolixibacteraceae bacterium]
MTSEKKITDLLTDHHNEMRELVKEIKKDNKKFILLKKHLDIHHELEEDLLLQILNKKEDVKDESLESQEEHLVINFLTLDLADFPRDNPRWKVKFNVFNEILDHHLEEEEEDLFPEAEEKLGKDKLVELGRKFSDLKEKRMSYVLETK